MYLDESLLLVRERENFELIKEAKTVKAED